MKSAILLSCILALASGAAAAQPFGFLASRTADERPEMLVLGTPHFDNPGRDVLNQKIEDVLAPDRQREIEAIVERLASFRPTHIAIEWKAGNQDALDKRYADYRAGRYKLSRDERDQIGLRLAAKLGHERIYAVDWNDMPPGAVENYDYYAWLEGKGRAGEFDAVREARQAELDEESRAMRCTNVAHWIRDLNSPEALADMHRFYFDIALIGDGEVNPGADWVGYWYGRNLKIFNNLIRLADQPEDRLLVIYGAGHAYLLSQFARESGAFTLADPLDHLPAAEKRAGCG